MLGPGINMQVKGIIIMQNNLIIMHSTAYVVYIIILDTCSHEHMPLEPDFNYGTITLRVKFENRKNLLSECIKTCWAQLQPFIITLTVQLTAMYEHASLLLYR